jgi:hypothetical protein
VKRVKLLPPEEEVEKAAALVTAKLSDPSQSQAEFVKKSGHVGHQGLLLDSSRASPAKAHLVPRTATYR